ncbi:MAG: hypothetical protein ABL898_04180 [Hyphomicrobiaceae bacterium]|nr:hypothetical protein [Hyphomicrobiaceae bacterium]
MRKCLIGAAVALLIGAAPAVAQDVGVASCDSFLKTYSTCVSAKVAEAQRPQMTATYDALKKNFVDVAKTAEGKAQLDGVCKQTAAKMKEQLAGLNCAW